MLIGIHPLVQQSLHKIIQDESGFSIIAEAGEVSEIFASIRILAPDFLICDIAKIGEKEAEALQQLRKIQPLSKIIVVGITADREHVLYALRAGACAYLRTQDAAEELIPALREADFARPYLCLAIIKDEAIHDFILHERNSPIL